MERIPGASAPYLSSPAPRTACGSWREGDLGSGEIFDGRGNSSSWVPFPRGAKRRSPGMTILGRNMFNWPAEP